MSKLTITLALFALFSVGLPLWGMQNNTHSPHDNHGCSGACYDQWKQATGGILALQQEAQKARAEASPAELGKQAYAGCVACHGAGGEGGIGPQLAGQAAAAIVDKLSAYRAGETLGKQSSMMWSQAQSLTDTDIDNLAAYIEAL